MVHHDAVIVFVSEIKRYLELGNIPTAITLCEGMLEQATKEKAKIEDPKLFKIKELGPTAESKTIIEKINEIIRDRNLRK